MKTKVELKLDEEAIRRLERTIKNWQPEKGDDASMRACYTQDRKDLRKVLSLCKRGKWQEAIEFARGLDTLVREMIPNGIWDHITSVEE